MADEKIKVYTYTKVSTAMQVDGYSLDAQKSRMEAYADFNGYEIVEEYEDAGKSGKIRFGAVSPPTAAWERPPGSLPTSSICF